MKQITYGFIKPHAYVKKDKIRKIITDSGLEIVAEKDPYYFTRELAEVHYENIKGSEFYENVVEKCLEGPTAQMLICGEDAIQRLYDLTGHTDPKKAAAGTIRAMFGSELPDNAFHRADSKANVLREVYMHFSNDELTKEAKEILETYKDKDIYVF